MYEKAYLPEFQRLLRLASGDNNKIGTVRELWMELLACELNIPRSDWLVQYLVDPKTSTEYKHADLLVSRTIPSGWGPNLASDYAILVETNHDPQTGAAQLPSLEDIIVLAKEFMMREDKIVLGNLWVLVADGPWVSFRKVLVTVLLPEKYATASQLVETSRRVWDHLIESEKWLHVETDADAVVALLNKIKTEA